METPEKTDGGVTLGAGGWEATSPRISVKHLDTHLGWWIGENATTVVPCVFKMEFPLPSLPLGPPMQTWSEAKQNPAFGKNPLLHLTQHFYKLHCCDF